MKTLKNIFPKTTLILLLITIVLSSCSSNDDNSNNDDTNDSDYYLTVKIDGVEFSTLNDDFATGGDAIVSTNADQEEFFTITGLGLGVVLQLTLRTPYAEGTFTPMLGDDVTSLGYQQSNPIPATWSASQDVGSGTITITENNATYMEGSFSFTGVNITNASTKEFTEGKFKAKKL